MEMLGISYQYQYLGFDFAEREGGGAYQDNTRSYPHEDIDKGQERNNPNNGERNIAKTWTTAMMISDTALHLRAKLGENHCPRD